MAPEQVPISNRSHFHGRVALLVPSNVPAVWRNDTLDNPSGARSRATTAGPSNVRRMLHWYKHRPPQYCSIISVEATSEYAGGCVGLPGGMQADELQKNKELGKHVTNLIQGLLEEKTILRWRLGTSTRSGNCDYRIR